MSASVTPVVCPLLKRPANGADDNGSFFGAVDSVSSFLLSLLEKGIDPESLAFSAFFSSLLGLTVLAATIEVPFGGPNMLAFPRPNRFVAFFGSSYDFFWSSFLGPSFCYIKVNVLGSTFGTSGSDRALDFGLSRGGAFWLLSSLVSFFYSFFSIF